MIEAARAKSLVGVSEPAAGRIVVTGELTFATARDARQLGVMAFEGSSATSFVVDCKDVTRADSAGLAVLLDWLAWARCGSRRMRLENLPEALVAIARISEVDGLLSAAV